MRAKPRKITIQTWNLSTRMRSPYTGCGTHPSQPLFVRFVGYFDSCNYVTHTHCWLAICTRASQWREKRLARYQDILSLELAEQSTVANTSTCRCTNEPDVRRRRRWIAFPVSNLAL